MKPQLLKVPQGPANSFSIRHEVLPNINNRWHYHPEVELIHFRKGAGTQFIGDNIKDFGPGDVVLLGSNLPHYWMFDPGIPLPSDEQDVYATVVHFQENFLGERFLHIPEARHIKQVLEKAHRGILISGNDSKKIARMISDVYEANGLKKVTLLIDCLSAIAECSNITLLSSIGFEYSSPDHETDRLNIVYNYTFNNFKKKIELQEIASVAGLIPNSFCRYFKARTGKTYSQFLLEVRIGYACKLLLANKYSIKQVCFESGFNNFSCFHKSFKLMNGKTPQNYQRAYMKN